MQADLQPRTEQTAETEVKISFLKTVFRVASAFSRHSGKGGEQVVLSAVFDLEQGIPDNNMHYKGSKDAFKALRV